MEDKEQIEEIALTFCPYSGKNIYGNCGLCINGKERHCDCFDKAKILVNKGYHKTIWHKVADGDLPKEDKDYLVIFQGNYYGVLRYCPYEMSDNEDDVLNIQKGFNGFDREMFEYYLVNTVIAWTELPEYKE